MVEDYEMIILLLICLLIVSTEVLRYSDSHTSDNLDTL